MNHKCELCNFYHSGCEGADKACAEYQVIMLDDNPVPPVPVRIPAAEKLAPNTPKGLAFERLAEKRLTGVLKGIRILGNCSNKYTYDYTPDEAANILARLNQAVDKVRKQFDV